MNRRDFNPQILNKLLTAELTDRKELKAFHQEILNLIQETTKLNKEWPVKYKEIQNSSNEFFMEILEESFSACSEWGKQSLANKLEFAKGAKQEFPQFNYEVQFRKV
ncbi:MAG: hypothetical protein JWM09_292 [Francisellaceae bacterium]|nr:hypothetical protein [Francisellaceae bacterium]